MISRSRMRFRFRMAGGDNDQSISSGILTESNNFLVQENGSYLLQE